MVVTQPNNKKNRIIGSSSYVQFPLLHARAPVHFIGASVCSQLVSVWGVRVLILLVGECSQMRGGRPRRWWQRLLPQLLFGSIFGCCFADNSVVSSPHEIQVESDIAFGRVAQETPTHPMDDCRPHGIRQVTTAIDQHDLQATTTTLVW